MSIKLKAIKDLIKQKKNNFAKALLKGDASNITNLYILSLLHRHDDEYDQELTVVEKALEIDANDVYMRERLAWHELPSFEKHEARSPLNLPDNPKYIPKQETLDQLCFVTGGDSNYFEYIVECIESIKNEKRYRNANVCVIDTGLTTEEVQYLYQKLNVTRVVDPGWNLPFTTMNFKTPCGINMKRTKEEARCYQFIMNAVFAYETFPEYDYFFVIQPDLWIHDSRFLDRMICITERKGMCRIFADLSPVVCKSTHFFRDKCIPIPQKACSHTRTPYFAIASLACMNKEMSKRVASYYKEFVSDHGLWLGYEEIAATVFLNSLKNPTTYALPFRHYFTTPANFGTMHCLQQNHNILVGSKGELFDFVLLSPLNSTFVQQDKKDRGRDNFYKKLPIFNSQNQYTLSPVRFRCHSGKNKEEIKNMLYREIK